MRALATSAAMMLTLTIASSSPAREAETRSTSRQPFLAVLVATAGVIGFGSAVVLGRERAKSDDATSHCSVDVCTSTAMLIVQDARAQSDTAFRLMGVSALALIGGVAMYMTSSKNSHAEIGLGAGGITFKTTF
jgi:hypothetical protein